MDRRRVPNLKGKGFCLIESTCKSLEKDYDVFYSPEYVLKKISKELVSNLEYTTFLKSPMNQDMVEYNMMEEEMDKEQKKKKGKAMCDFYLPAMATALDVHIRVIKNIGGYFAVLNTLPTIDTHSLARKTVNLLFDGERYFPVIYTKTQGNVAVVSPQMNPVIAEVPSTSGNCAVQIIGYTPPPPPTEVIVISDTDEEIVPETQTYPGIVPETQIPHEIEVVPETQSPPEIEVVPETQSPPEIEVVPETQSPPELEPSFPLSPSPINIIPLDGTQDIDSQSLPTISPPNSDERKRIPFDMQPFKGMVPKVVNKIPYNINGTQYYLIEVPENEYFCEKYRDGRFFVLNTSRRKGFRGVRRVGKCRGNFICINEECPFWKQEKKHNENQFTNVGGQKFCFSCNGLSSRKKCGAVKMIEYAFDTRYLRVYHNGNHTCHLKPNTTENDDFINESLKSLGGKVTPKELAQIQMTKELQKQMEEGVTDMAAIVDIAAKLTNKQRISEIKSRMQTQLKSEKHSLSAVAELKTITDTSDRFLIYKIYDSNMTGRGHSYVFKSSKKMGQLAINMDQNQLLRCPLMEEPAYFDGMHRRCEGWKTLTMWLYHPSSCKLNRIATMEVKAEDSANCAQF